MYNNLCKSYEHPKQQYKTHLTTPPTCTQTIHTHTTHINTHLMNMNNSRINTCRNCTQYNKTIHKLTTTHDIVQKTYQKGQEPYHI